MSERAILEKQAENLLRRFSEVEEALSDPSIFGSQKEYKKLSQEHSYLSKVKGAYEYLKQLQNSAKDLQLWIRQEQDAALIGELREELRGQEELLEKQWVIVDELLVPPDPNDDRNTLMEIRAGTGGDEAAIFVGDCVRMYQLYADHMGWSYECLSATESEVGGYKEYVMVLSGPSVHKYLQFEGGTHRVQRVPETETQGRVHTSAITVAILMEPDEEEEIKLDERELRIDTYRSSGAGGQHVNTTDSAVRITHLPTGLVAYCQAERSQHKNKDKAMRLLTAKVAEQEAIKKQKAIADNRATQVGSGDRSERIRTYNYSQNRVTDHRVESLTLYSLDAIMDGEMGPLIGPLVTYFKKKTLEEI